MIAIIFWIAGAGFTFTYTEKPNQGWWSVFGLVMSLLTWPLILGNEVRSNNEDATRPQDI